MNVKSIVGLVVVLGVGTGAVLAHAGEPQATVRPTRAAPACIAFHDSLSVRMKSPMHDSLMSHLHGINHDLLMSNFHTMNHDSTMAAVQQMPCDSLIAHIRAMHGDSIFAALGIPLPDSLDLQDPAASAGWLHRVHDHLRQFFMGLHGHHDTGAPAAH